MNVNSGMMPSRFASIGCACRANWFPIPYTTNLPLIVAIGCTTCSWQPRIRSISGESSSRFASAVWPAFGVCEYSTPQWIDSTTICAPAARAMCAARRIAAGSVSLASHVSPAGRVSPLNPNVKDSCAIRTGGPPPVGVTVRMFGTAASAALR